jgi:hypothetical protein
MMHASSAPGWGRDAEVEVEGVEGELAADIGDEEREHNAPGEGEERAGVGSDEPEAAAGGGHLGEVAEDGGGAGWAGEESEEGFGGGRVWHVRLLFWILRANDVE